LLHFWLNLFKTSVYFPIHRSTSLFLMQSLKKRGQVGHIIEKKIPRKMYSYTIFVYTVHIEGLCDNPPLPLPAFQIVIYMAGTIQTNPPPTPHSHSRCLKGREPCTLNWKSVWGAEKFLTGKISKIVLLEVSTDKHFFPLIEMPSFYWRKSSEVIEHAYYIVKKRCSICIPRFLKHLNFGKVTQCNTIFNEFVFEFQIFCSIVSF
jgi:hypothetical protein